MTFVGLLGLLISICAVPLAFPGRTRDRYVIGLSLFIIHVSATLVYYSYVTYNDADTALYYFDPYGFSLRSTSLGTVFLIQLVQYLRRAIGGSYLDYFILFQSFGFIGIVILSRTIKEMQERAGMPYTKWSLLVLFLPSMHFWTSAIGKDAPLFFASSLAVWSLLYFSTRWPWFVAAVAVMLLFRPHIALIAAMSLALSFFMDSRYKLLPRFAFLTMAIGSSIFLLGAVRSTLLVNVTDPNSISEFVASQQAVGATVSGTTAVNGTFVVRLLSLLFRPFFIDADNAFGLITSLENAVFLLSSLIVILNFRAILWFFRNILFFKYCCVFTIILTLLLAAVYYNVGLGLRERVMVYPALMPIFLLAWAASAARRHGLRKTRLGSGSPKAAESVLGSSGSSTVETGGL